MGTDDFQATTSRITPRQRRWLWLVAAVLVVAHLACVNNQWYPSPDSALYVALGRSIAEGDGYVFNGQVDNTVTPGLPIVIAGARLFTGGEGWWLCNALITATGFVALGYIWAVLRRLLPSDTGAWPPPARPREALLSLAPAPLAAAITTLMLAGSHLFFLHAHYLLTDVPFIALAWAALYAALRASRGHVAWLAVTVLLSVAAMTIRAPMVPFLSLLAVGVALQPLPGPVPSPAWRRWLAGGVLLAGTLGTVAFWYVWGRSMGPLPYVESASQNAAAFSTRVAGAAWALAGIMSTLLVSNTDVPWMGIIGWAVSMLGLAVLWRRGLRLGLLVVVPYTLFIAVTRREEIPERYLLPVAPLLYLGLVQGAWSIAMAVGHHARSRRQRGAPSMAAPDAPITRTPLIVLFLLLAIVLIPNAGRIGSLAYRMAYLAHTDSYDNARGGFIREHKEIAELTRALPEDSPFIAPRGPGRIVHYYSRRPFLQLPLQIGESLDADTAQRFWAFWQGNPDIPLIVLPWPDQDRSEKFSDYTNRLSELFANQHELHRGKQSIVFERS